MMANPSNTIIITDDEESPSSGPGISRPLRVPRRDYSYRDFESMISQAVNEEADTEPTRKRKRTATKELSTLDNAFEKLQRTVSHEIRRLREKNRILRDKLLQEREKNKKTQEELSHQREKRVLECNICYRQPDRWAVIQCGHMFCRSCLTGLTGLQTKSCPTCRTEMTGFIGCYPFAG